MATFTIFLISAVAVASIIIFLDWLGKDVPPLDADEKDSRIY